MILKSKHKTLYNYLLGLMLFFLSGETTGQDYQSGIYKAYLSGQMNDWKKIIDEMEALQNKSDAFTLQLLNYQFGYIGWCLSQDNKSQAEKYIDAAQINIKILEKHQYRLSTINAYKSAIYGFMIGIHPFKTISLGPKSVAAARLSMKQDSSDPNGYLQYGHALYHMPGIFGGSKNKAIQYYLTAFNLMNRQKEMYQGDWNYLNLLSTLAQAYEKTEQYQKAYKYYQLILQTEPRFSWVKNELFPEFLKKNKKHVQ